MKVLRGGSVITDQRASAADLALTSRPLLTLCGIVFITFLDTTIVSVALAAVQTSLHAGVVELQWVVNGYALAFASLMLAAGSLSDRYGRRKTMLCGLVLFSVGSLLAAVAPTVIVLIAGRVVMGIGAAACEPGTLSIIRHLYPDSRERTRALGSWAAVCGLALAAGPVLGGALVGVASWRAVFYFSLGAGLIAIVATLTSIPESADPPTARPDALGFILGSASLACLAVAVILGEGSGYAAPQVVTLFVLGLVGALAFVLVEKRAAAPMLDLKYLRVPEFSGVLTISFAVFFGIFSIFFFSALYLQVVIGFSGYRTAAEFVPMTLGLVGASMFAGRIVARVGPRAPLAVGASMAGAGTLWAATIFSRPGIPTYWLIGALCLSGIGFGLSVVPVTSVALSVIPSEHSGMAASAINTSRELGAVFGVAALGALVNSHLTTDLTARLHTLGIPSAFQAIVIGAVETGGVPSGGTDTGATKAFGPIVAKVISAAYGAFRSGLEISLVVSGVVLLCASLVAFVTLGRTSTSWRTARSNP